MTMHWAEIICEIQKKGFTLSRIAASEKVSKSVVTEVIRGTKTSHPVAYAISQITNIPTEKMWPGRYLESPAEYRKLRGDNERGRLPEIRRAS
jgi:lambda repressor-like predicted transcriptional regulator